MSDAIEVHDAAVTRMLARARMRQDEVLRKELVEIGDEVAVEVRAAAPRSGAHRGRGATLADSFKTRSRANSVTVSSNKPYAAIMEAGGTTPAHDITPKKAGALAFNGTVTKLVHHPGAHYEGKHFAAETARRVGRRVDERVASAVARSFE